MFVTKLNATGSALTYSTFSAGTQVDNGQGIAVDAGGNAYALGFSSSTDFPTTPGAFDTTANGALRRDRDEAESRRLGARLLDLPRRRRASTTAATSSLDGGGNAYVSGGTGSTDFPTTPGAFDTTSDGSDAFVTKLNAAGSARGLLDRARRQRQRLGDRHRARHGAATPGSRAARRPPTSRSAPMPPTRSFNGGSDAIIAELERSGLGRALRDVPRRLASRRRLRHRRATRRATSTSPAPPSRGTSRPRPVRSTRSGTAIRRSSGATPS